MSTGRTVTCGIERFDFMVDVSQRTAANDLWCTQNRYRAASCTLEHLFSTRSQIAWERHHHAIWPRGSCCAATSLRRDHLTWRVGLFFFPQAVVQRLDPQERIEERIYPLSERSALETNVLTLPVWTENMPRIPTIPASVKMTPMIRSNGWASRPS